jgi:hypothetical protein
MSKRIERLEQQAGITATPPPNVFFCFADPEIADHAPCADRTWQRKPGEQGREFEARILVELELAGCNPPKRSVNSACE